MEFAQPSRAYRPPATAMLVRHGGAGPAGLIDASVCRTWRLSVAGHGRRDIGRSGLPGACKATRAHLLCAMLLIEELSGASFLPLTEDSTTWFAIHC